MKMSTGTVGSGSVSVINSPPGYIFPVDGSGSLRNIYGYGTVCYTLSLPSDTELFGIWMSARVADSAWLRIAEHAILHLAMSPPLLASAKNKKLGTKIEISRIGILRLRPLLGTIVTQWQNKKQKKFYRACIHIRFGALKNTDS
jgi:hypothetical protein